MSAPQVEWQELIDELMAARPRLQIVQKKMVAVGIQPADTLIQCLEQVYAAIDQRKERSKGTDHELN